MDLDGEHPAMVAQVELLAVVAAGSTSMGIYSNSPASARQFFIDLAAMGQRIMHYASADELRAYAPQDLWNAHEHSMIDRVEPLSASALRFLVHDSSATLAMAVCVALPILQASSPTEAGRRLRWLIDSMRDRRWATAAAIVWGREISPQLISVQLSMLASLLGPVEQLRNRCWSQHPGRPGRGHHLHGSVPAWLWPQWAAQVNAPGVGLSQVRMVLSVALLTVGSHMSVPSACAVLGPATTKQAVARVLNVLSRQCDWARTASMLTGLAELLADGLCPIDYQRRRELDVDLFLADPRRLHLGNKPRTTIDAPVRAQLCRWWLYERLTGSAARRHPAAPEDPRFWRWFTNLPAWLSPEDVAALDGYGRAVLDRHGMAGEPLRWQPPLDSLGASDCDENGWPSIDLARLHCLIRVGHLSVGQAATSLGTSIDVVRETLNDHPAPLLRRAVPGSVIAHARAVLTRDQLIDQYVHQGQSLRTIAEPIGVSPHTIRDLAHSYGIPLRSAPYRRVSD